MIFLDLSKATKYRIYVAARNSLHKASPFTDHLIATTTGELEWHFDYIMQPASKHNPDPTMAKIRICPITLLSIRICRLSL